MREKEVDCEIKFDENRLIVDRGSGITASQLLDIKSEKVHTGNWISSWHYHLYKIKYISKNGETKQGSFRFYNDGVNALFKKDLQIWSMRGSSIGDINTHEYQENPEAARRVKEAAGVLNNSIPNTIDRLTPKQPVRVQVEETGPSYYPINPYTLLNQPRYTPTLP